MSLDIAKLTKVRQQASGVIVARCPACAAAGQDHDGTHLKVFPDGRFACVVFPGRDGQQHRKEIWAIAGNRRDRRPPPIIKFTVKCK